MFVRKGSLRARDGARGLLLLALVALAACGGDGKTPTDPGPGPGPGPGPTITVASVAIDPITTTVLPGTTVQLTARVLGSNNQQLTDRQITWTSSDNNVALVSSAGVVTGQNAGTATITATAEGRSGSLQLTVNNPVPTIATISPNSLEVGQAGTITVNGTNFVSASTIRVNGNPVATTFVSATQLRANLAAQQATGTLGISVFNPTPGGGPSATVNLTITAPATNPACQVFTTITTTGTTFSGSLNSSDCLLANGSFADFYRFTVTAPFTLRITLNGTGMDAFLRITDTNGRELITDNNSAGGTNARIDATFAPGTYVIQATTNGAGQQGTYTLNLSSFFLTVGGNTPAPCLFANAQAITVGTTIVGNFQTTDCPLTDGTFMDLYRLVVASQQQLTIEMDGTTQSLDPFLFLFDSNFTVIASDNNSGGGFLSARITRNFTPGTYFIGANSVFDPCCEVLGPYRLVVRQ